MEDNSPESPTSKAAPPSIVEGSELEQVQPQLIFSWIHLDRSALERLLAQEWMVTHTDARLSTRDEMLRDLDTGANRLLGAAWMTCDFASIGFRGGHRPHTRWWRV
jgi:hypothetical protein